MKGKWVLGRDDDGYWYWEHSDGRESPIFCVRELARQWMRCLKRRKQK